MGRFASKSQELSARQQAGLDSEDSEEPNIEEFSGPLYETPEEQQAADLAADLAEAWKPTKEELAKFDPQDYLMDNFEYFVSQSVQYNKRYRFLLPIVGATPSEINQLFIGTPGIERFMNIDAKSFAQITPKIDLFKVIYPTESSKGTEIPIPFNKTLTSDEKGRILQNRQSRGVGSGVISFDWELAGRNPAEAKTHIKANLKIFLKSIAELDEIRATYDRTHHVRYLDLIHRELKKINKNTYNPNYFLLKANVGWRAGSSVSPLLKKALEKCQTSMYLALYKHELEFNDDGSVILTCNYIGYIASLLADTDLFNPEKKVQPNVYGGPPLENYQNILRDMVEGSGRVYRTTVRRKEERDPETDEVTRITYSLGEGEGHVVNPLRDMAAQAKEGEASNDLLEKFKDSTMGVGGYQLKWFYFGDLIDTVLSYAYRRPEMGRVRFMLGPVIIDDEYGQPVGVNLCDIPISLDMYQIWFQEKIINEKIENLSVGTFLQKAFDTLVKAALLSGRSKARRNEIKVPSLTFSQFSLPETGNGTDPIFGEPEYKHVAGWGVSGVGDLNPRKPHSTFNKKQIFQTSSHSELKHYHYFLMYSTNERVYARQFGKSIPERKDSKDGIYYFSTGRRNNIVRNIQFNKQDVPHLSEANIQRSGMKNTVLRGFYNATITMEGAPIFKPGMIIYIDGAAMAAGDTRKLNALSRRLGFGGYYVILKANHEISQGNFETNLECAWLSFGDEPVTVRFHDIEERLIYSEINKLSDVSW